MFYKHINKVHIIIQLYAEQGYEHLEVILPSYEGRSESSNNCLIIHIIFIVKQKEAYRF